MRREQLANHRILLVDDNTAIHEDFRKVLAPPKALNPQVARGRGRLVWGRAAAARRGANFELHSAFQGQEALAKVRQAVAAGKPYALAFVDVRMPPGWDGIETVTRLWAEDPDLQVVICTAYSDYSWEEMTAKLGLTNNLVLLKKPFDNVEVLQLAHALTRKWNSIARPGSSSTSWPRWSRGAPPSLRTANLALEHEFQERLQLERQFRQAQKMEAIGQLAAGVAHDFNNILTVIQGHASMLLLRLGESARNTKSAREIRNCAERAASLVRQLLMFSRKQAHAVPQCRPWAKSCNVSSMLRQAARRAHRPGDRLRPELPAIYADRGMIEQVIINLAINARDAMPRGGRLTISSLRRSAMPPGRPRPGAEARPGTFRLPERARTPAAAWTPQPSRILRAVLHHQGSRQRHRPGPGHGLWHRQTAPRVD